MKRNNFLIYYIAFLFLSPEQGRYGQIWTDAVKSRLSGNAKDGRKTDGNIKNMDGKHTE